MGRKPSPKASAKVDVSAKVGATATVKYSRERKTLQVIPPDVTRANAGTWLDIISPITQWAGLKGDVLRHKRELLRLQQEDTLLEIARRFRERKGETSFEKPLPNKFVVPFLEQASLEDPDSPLVDLWTNLLVSSSENFIPAYNHFVSIISRLSAQQGEIFKAIVSRASDIAVLQEAMEITPFWSFSNVRSILTGQAFAVRVISNDRFDRGAFIAEIRRDLNSPAISLTGGTLHGPTLFEGQQNIDFGDLIIYQQEQALDYAILVALGLLNFVDTGYVPLERWNVTLSYYLLTELGFHFAVACRMVPGELTPSR